MADIGETLRDARMRARIDVSEIEAKTKIRAKYLRALENEEWGLLPGPTFVKSFLRTYAQALGLDGKALVEEYRQRFEEPGEAALEPIVAGQQRSRTRSGPGGRSPSGGPSRGYMAIVGVVLVVIVLLIVGLVTNGGGSSSKSTSARNASHPAKHRRTKGAGSHSGTTTTTRSQASVVALSLRPTATVYVCLIGDNGRRVIPGEELHAGTHTPTYHAHHFTITLGNSSVTMYVDGHARVVAPSSQAIGYSINRAGERKRLAQGSLPTCL
jgi:cytoskeletal protein RodZ